MIQNGIHWGRNDDFGTRKWRLMVLRGRNITVCTPEHMEIFFRVPSKARIGIKENAEEPTLKKTHSDKEAIDELFRQATELFDK